MSAFVVLWAKGVILVALALAASVIPKLTASARHLILLLALIGVPLLPVISSLTPVPIALAPPASFLTFTPTVTALTGVSGQMSIPDDQSVWQPSLTVLGFIYAAVALMILGYWLIQLRRTVSWFNQTSLLQGPSFASAIETERTFRHVTLRQDSALGSPVTWGVWHPCIVVPRDWQEWPVSKRQSSLRHEFAHIHRYDTLTSSVGMLMCCLFWINPLVWIAHRRMLHEAESACDDVVVRSGVSPADYASQLLTIARASNLKATAAMASVSLLSRRIEALLNNNIRRVPMKTIQSLLIVSVMTALIIPISSLHADLDGQTLESAKEEFLQQAIEEEARQQTMQETTYGILSEAQLLIEGGTPIEAVAVLQEAMATPGLNSYEVAQIWNTLAYAHYSLEDMPKTIHAYQQVLAQGEGSITAALEMNSLHALFQLYFVEEEFNAALTNIDRWLKLRESPDPATIYLKATCYHKLADYRSSLTYALETEQLAVDQAVEVRESWLYLQVLNYSELEDYDNVVSVLERLIVLFPKPQYEEHLAGIRDLMERAG